MAYGVSRATWVYINAPFETTRQHRSNKHHYRPCAPLQQESHKAKRTTIFLQLATELDTYRKRHTKASTADRVNTCNRTRDGRNLGLNVLCHSPLWRFPTSTKVNWKGLLFFCPTFVAMKSCAPRPPSPPRIARERAGSTIPSCEGRRQLQWAHCPKPS